jgi:hypothetical protein
MSLRASSLARFVSYGQHGSDTTCHTLFLRNRIEASIRVLRKLNHIYSDLSWQNRCNVSIINKHSIILLQNDLGSEKITEKQSTDD